jgi:ferredoxin
MVWKFFKSACCGEKKEASAKPPVQPRADRRIVAVWIDPGCVVCDACAHDCPEVFEVERESSRVKPDAAEYFVSRREQIEMAADGCCVDVIRVKYEDGTIKVSIG